MSHILVFGDSVSYGRWDAKGGWVSQLINFYMEKDMNDPDFYHEVYNLSIDGDDSKKLVRRLEFELKQRLPQRGKVVVIFAIGKNDSCFVKNKKGFITSPKVFRKNMEKFVKISKKYSSKILFVGTASINEIETMPVSWDKN